MSQVNPFSALFLPVNSGVPLLQEVMALLKNQLLGFAQGVSQLAEGRLMRPGGHRAIDIAMQDYLGTVTVFPHWEISELGGLIKNMDAPRLEQYELDGQRAVWPQVRSCPPCSCVSDWCGAQPPRNLPLIRAPKSHAPLISCS